jgi:hypothetical protein
MPRQSTSNILLDLLTAFFSSVGADIGYYDPKAKALREGVEENTLYQANLETLSVALKSGWKARDLKDWLWAQYRSGVRAALLAEILPEDAPGREVGENDNLISRQSAYSHPALHLFRPPTYVIGEDGLLPRTAGAVARKETFTLRDLTNYYYSRFPRLARTNRTWDSSLFLMKRLYLRAGAESLEMLLTAIDIASSQHDNPSAVRWDDYLGLAEESLRVSTGVAV